MDAMIHRIFLNLSRRFQSLDPLTNADVSELPFRALNLITRLRNAAVSTRSYELFKTIMESDVGQERKMEAARLALHAAYPPGLESVPPARDPQLILSFLRSHVDPGVGRNDHTISSAMRAIDSASENPASQSWTWRIENAGELLTWFGQSTYPEEFNWWYGVLWLHYGELDPEVRDRMDEIGMSGDDRVDLKQCRVAVEKEIERVKGLDGAKSIVRSLEDAYDRLTALINYREMVSGEFSSIWTGLISLTRPVTSAIPLLRGSPYRAGLPAAVDDPQNRPLSIRMFFFFNMGGRHTVSFYSAHYHLSGAQPCLVES